MLQGSLLCEYVPPSPNLNRQAKEVPRSIAKTQYYMRREWPYKEGVLVWSTVEVKDWTGVVN